MAIVTPTALTGAAIQVAIDSLVNATAPFPNSSRPTVQLERQTYMISEPIVIPANLRASLAMVGSGTVSGTTLRATSSFPAGQPIIKVHCEAAGLYTNDNDFLLEEFAIECSEQPNCTGLLIESVGVNNSYASSLVRNVVIRNALRCVWVLNARQVVFDRVGFWSGDIDNTIGALIEANASGFAGDLNFNECLFTAKSNRNSRSVVIRATGPTAPGNDSKGQLKGLGFTNCTFHSTSGYVDITASAGAAIGDIWFNSRCQFDGDLAPGLGRGIVGEALGANSIIDNLNVDGVYFRGLLANQPTIYLNAQGGGRINSPRIVNCWVANNAQPLADLINVDCAVVSNNRIYACGFTGGNNMDHYIGFTNCRAFTCSGNVAAQVDRATYWGVRIDNACDRFTVVGNTFYGAVNLGNVDNAAGGSALRIVDNNA